MKWTSRIQRIRWVAAALLGLASLDLAEAQAQEATTAATAAEGADPLASDQSSDQATEPPAFGVQPEVDANPSADPLPAPSDSSPTTAPSSTVPSSGASAAFLWNISSQPLHYRVRRARGVTWSDQRVLPAGEKLLFSTANLEDALGVVSDPRYLVIEYVTARGMMRARLSSRSLLDPEVVLPYYFFYEDADGVGLLVQTADRERAEEVQAEEQRKRKSTPEQLVERTEQFRLAGIWRPLPASAFAETVPAPSEFEKAPTQAAPGEGAMPAAGCRCRLGR